MWKIAQWCQQQIPVTLGLRLTKLKYQHWLIWSTIFQKQSLASQYYRGRIMRSTFHVLIQQYRQSSVRKNLESKIITKWYLRTRAQYYKSWRNQMSDRTMTRILRRRIMLRTLAHWKSRLKMYLLDTTSCTVHTVDRLN